MSGKEFFDRPVIVEVLASASTDIDQDGTLRVTAPVVLISRIADNELISRDPDGDELISRSLA